MHIVAMLGRSVWRNVQADGDATRRFHTCKFDGIGEEILVNYVKIDATDDLVTILTIRTCMIRVGSSETDVLLSSSFSSLSDMSIPEALASCSNILTASLAIESSWTSTGVITNNPESNFDIVRTSRTKSADKILKLLKVLFGDEY